MKDQMFVLNDWAVTYVDSHHDGYTAPECVKKCLVGIRDSDGKTVRTSHIVESHGRNITTRSGTVYILGIPGKDYLAWLSTNGYQFNEDDPIKIIKL